MIVSSAWMGSRRHSLQRARPGDVDSSRHWSRTCRLLTSNRPVKLDIWCAGAGIGGGERRAFEMATLICRGNSGRSRFDSWRGHRAGSLVSHAAQQVEVRRPSTAHYARSRSKRRRRFYEADAAAPDVETGAGEPDDQRGADRHGRIPTKPVRLCVGHEQRSVPDGALHIRSPGRAAARGQDRAQRPCGGRKASIGCALSPRQAEDGGEAVLTPKRGRQAVKTVAALGGLEATAGRAWARI
jgi:hypothetical protein